MEDDSAWEVEQRMLLLQPDPQSPQTDPPPGEIQPRHTMKLLVYDHWYLKLSNFRSKFENIHSHTYIEIHADRECVLGVCAAVSSQP